MSYLGGTNALAAAGNLLSDLTVWLYPLFYPSVFFKNLLLTQLETPLISAPAIKMPIEGIITGSHRPYHRSNPKSTSADRPTRAMANQKKQNKTKKEIEHQ